MSLLYIIKVNVCLALVWSFCRLVLGRDTRFGWKRTCLNAGIVLSLLLPGAAPVVPFCRPPGDYVRCKSVSGDRGHSG